MHKKIQEKPRLKKSDKRKPWDNRFYLGKMTGSTPGKLENSKSSQKKLEPVNIQDLQEQIHSIWQKFSVPKELQRYYIETLCTPSAGLLLQREVQDLRKGRSILQVTLKSIEARQESVSSIEEMNMFLKEAEGWTSMEQVKIECAQLLHAHRILTLSVVENIVKWREHISQLQQMQEISVSRPIFEFAGGNYLLKIKRDLDFLSDSDFARVFGISSDPDPFLICPSKGTSGKKPNQNSYFMDGSQVFIPLPSILLNRVKVAHQVVFEEEQEFGGNWAAEIYEELLSSLLGVFCLDARREFSLGQDSDTILNDLIDGLIPDLCREVIQQRSEFDEGMLVDSLIFSLLPDICAQSYLDEQTNRAISEKLSEQFLEELIPSVCVEISQDSQNGMHIDKLEDDITDGLIQSFIDTLCRDMASDQMPVENVKARNLMEHQITQMIYRDLIESEINELDIEQLSGNFIQRSVLKRRTTIKDTNEQARLLAIEIDMQNTEIAKIVFQDTLKTFLDQPWMEEVAQLMLTVCATDMLHLEDKAIQHFTPRVHSPAAYSLADDNSDILGESFQLEYDLAIGVDHTSLDGLMFKPAKQPLSLIPLIMSEYVSFVPSDIQEVLNDSHTLQKDILSGNDACWYWGLIDGKIFGALLYYIDSASGCIVIVHVSCLSFGLFKSFVEKVCGFLWEKTFEIRVNLYSKQGIDRNMKLLLGELHFRWKSEQFAGDTEITVMGRENQSKSSQFKQPITVQTGTVLQVSNQRLEPGLHSKRALVGLRMNMVSAALKAYGKSQNAKIVIDDKPRNTLQRELNDLVHRISQQEFFDFPGLENPGFMQSTEGNPVAAYHFDLNWTACTNLTHWVLNQDYKYTSFYSENIRSLVDGEHEVLVVPTSIQHISAFFIRGALRSPLYVGMIREDSDLFSWTQDVLNECHEGNYCSGFMAPCFTIEYQSRVPWVEGFCVPAQSDGQEDRFVSGCSEKIAISMDPPGMSEGGLINEIPRDYALEGEFVFGLMLTKMGRESDLPLFAVFVEKKDWILAD